MAFLSRCVVQPSTQSTFLTGEEGWLQPPAPPRLPSSHVAPLPCKAQKDSPSWGSNAFPSGDRIFPVGSGHGPHLGV